MIDNTGRNSFSVQSSVSSRGPEEYKRSTRSPLGGALR
jgi:hypothetical protein